MSDDWSKWEKLVLSKLDDHKSYLIALDKRTQDHGRRIAVLQVKAGLWGALGGLISAVGLALVSILK